MNTTESRQGHTRGPWIVDETLHHDGGRWVKTSGLYSVRVLSGSFNSKERPKIEDEERDANARLIAAAPTLLEALRGLLDGLACQSDLFRAEQQARAAIALALGKEQP